MTNFSLRFALNGLLAVAFFSFLCGCGTDPVKEYEKGDSAFKNADYKTAAERFREVVELSPDNVDALVMLARSEFALGDVDAAGKTLQKAAVTNGGDPDILELTAQIAFFCKDYDRATKTFARLATDTRFDAATRSIGWTGMGIVDFVKIGLHPEVSRYRHESRVKFLQAVTLDRRNASARYHLGRLYRDTFQYLDAAKDEFSAYVHLETVNDGRMRKIKNEVLPSLTEEIKRQSASLSASADSVACASFLKKGDDFFRRKQYKNAALSYSKALRKDSGSYPAAVGLARSYARSNRTRSEQEESLKAYLVACKIRPSAITTYLEAADMAIRIGSSATAVELYSRALAANPVSKPAVEGLVSALTRSGDTQAASVYRGYLRTLTKSK